VRGDGLSARRGAPERGPESAARQCVEVCCAAMAVSGRPEKPPAQGCDAKGRREPLALHIGPSEAETFWAAFLNSLMKRGLKGVRLVVSDAHEGIKLAITHVLGATSRRCRAALPARAEGGAGAPSPPSRSAQRCIPADEWHVPPPAAVPPPAYLSCRFPRFAVAHDSPARLPSRSAGRRLARPQNDWLTPAA
jgi:hypothetical protein